MKIFDIFKKKKENQVEKDPVINDRTVNFEIKFDNSKVKYIKTDEGILKLSTKNATEIFRQTVKLTTETFYDGGIYEPHINIDIEIVRFFKSNNGRYFFDITSSNPKTTNYIYEMNEGQVMQYIWNDLNKLPCFYYNKATVINSQIFDQEIYNSFIGEY